MSSPTVSPSPARTPSSGHSDEILVSRVPSPLGTLLLYCDRKGLVALDFPGAAVAPGSIMTPPDAREPLHRAAAALEAYFQAGKPLPRTLKSRLDGTDFQKKVWAAIETIPWGKTRSYGEIAAQIGHPGASRAVGAACGANPLPLFIPCHRVLAANGKVGGFTGGLDVKRRLLQLEGVALSP
ncbi:MAG TPA: methylated-DNA--[protein]-cysteine S-methyltransferase [Fibrobacteria bacterium]|nr:methylated-DNA--[protein]-cysteine S-methyltransferase [Fibrobacteria bacterium]